MATAPLVLIVEDDESICTLLRYNLQSDGYRVVIAHDGDAGLHAVSEHRPDLVLLDWMLPKISGIEVCRILRRTPRSRDLPIIMVTAKDDEVDKVRGLQTGADDYVAKPFSIAELMARISGLLRRSRVLAAKGTVSSGEILLDLDGRKVFRKGRLLHLGPTEFRLLQFFIGSPGRVFGRDELLNAVWGPDIYVEPRTIDVHIRRLRHAVNGNGETDIIRTVRGTGYSYEPAGDS